MPTMKIRSKHGDGVGLERRVLVRPSTDRYTPRFVESAQLVVDLDNCAPMDSRDLD